MLTGKQWTYIFSGLTVLVLVGSYIFVSFSREKTTTTQNNNTESEHSHAVSILPSVANPETVDVYQFLAKPKSDSVLSEVYPNEYYVYPCEGNGVKEKVLMLVAKPDETMNPPNTARAQQTMRRYETSMYKDWGNIIYEERYDPMLTTGTFSNAVIIDEHIMADSYRVATLSDQKNKLYYGWMLNYIVVAGSEACLLSTMESVYHVH